jgi:hypothetical protein
MNCERLSDRMAGVLAGRDHWNREDEEHLVVCADCRSEWQLLARGAALGGDLPALDAGSIASQVQLRLARANQRAKNLRRGWIGIGLAAAAVLVLVVARPDGKSPPGPGPISATNLEIPFIELDSLSPAQLQAVLETLEPPLGSSSTMAEPSLHDLDVQQPERLLRSLECCCVSSCGGSSCWPPPPRCGPRTRPIRPGPIRSAA